MTTLNAGSSPATPLGMSKARSPRKKLRGVQAPAASVDLLDLILAAENAAVPLMGGESKVSLSDLISEAIDEWVSRWCKDNGEPPKDAATAAGKEFVRKLAERNLAKVRADLLSKTH